MPRGRWVEYAERAGLVLAFLMLVPWPMRVGTDATVVPAERRVVSAIDGGVVQRVFVHEGDTVQAGQVLAQLDDGDDRVKLAQAESALAQAQRDLADAEFRNDPSAAGQAKIRADLHEVEVQLEQQRVAEAQLRAPIAGMVVTPKVEEKAGTMVKPGDAFAEIVGEDRMAAEMSVPEKDLELVHPGKNVALKLNAFPTTTFEGTVERIGAQTQSDAGEQYFIVRAVFDNPGGLRAGWHGGTRANSRRAADGLKADGIRWDTVLLRAPFRWLWQEVVELAALKIPGGPQRGTRIGHDEICICGSNRRGGDQRRRLRKFDGGVQPNAGASGDRCSVLRAVVPAGHETGDILSVLTVEHQVDIIAQRDGVVVSVTKDEGSAVKQARCWASSTTAPADGNRQSPRRSASGAEQRKYKEAELKAKTAALHRQQQLRALGLSSHADLEAAEFEAKAAEYDMHG